MTTGAGLDALFHPQVVAVVGASRNPAKWGRRVLEYSAGFGGSLYGVNPGAGDLGLPGVRTVSTLAEITEPIDLAVIARPASATPDIVDECAALGVRSVLITAAGFGEMGTEGRAAEERMTSRARSVGMRLLGPNTFGLFVPGVGINLTPRQQIPTGNVALLTQSGNVAVAMYQHARRAGIGFSVVAGVGNQIDIGLGELLSYFATHVPTTAIALYVEGLRGSGADFRAGLAVCQAAGKPVVVLKAGSGATAAAAVATHTGALAADNKVWQAVLDEAGAIRVTSTQDMVDVAAAVSAIRPHSGRVMVFSDGGGDSVMAIDALTNAGLSLATPGPETRAALDSLTPPAAPRTDIGNPVTLDTAGGVEDDPTLWARCAKVASAGGGVDVLVLAGLFGGYPKMLTGELTCAEQLIALHKTGNPVAVQSAFADADPEPIARLKQAGIPVYSTVDRLARALAHTATLAQPASGAGTSTHTEVLPIEESAALLKEHGIELPPMILVSDRDQLAAATVPYPACVKIADPAVAHKSDIGGVRLRLADATQVQAAADELWQRFPGSPLLVMPSLSPGTELLVGAGTDPLFGPYVLIGRGGIWAETDPDVAIRLAPVDEEKATEALLSLRFAPTFTGRRGTKSIDIPAIARLIAAMSQVVAAHPEISVEANPVIAYPDGYAVADLRASNG